MGIPKEQSMKVVAYNRQFVNTVFLGIMSYTCLLTGVYVEIFHSLRKLLRYGRKNGGGFSFTRVIPVKYYKNVNGKRVIYFRMLSKTSQVSCVSITTV